MGDIANDVLNGFQCSHCGVIFKKEHGYPVLCKSCYDDVKEEERAGLSKAQIKEI